jgi:hypothetical protein
LPRLNLKPRSLATQCFKQLPSFSNLLSQGSPQLDRLFRKRSMLQGIAVAARRAGAFGATMHAAAPLAGDGWRPTAPALAGFGSASRAMEHRAPVARMALRSRLRSAISPIYDARQPLDRIGDHIASRADLSIAA